MFEPKSNLFIYWSNGIPPVSYISRNNCQIHSNELHFYLWLIVGSPPFHDLINKHIMYVQLINRCFIQVKLDLTLLLFATPFCHLYWAIKKRIRPLLDMEMNGCHENKSGFSVVIDFTIYRHDLIARGSDVSFHQLRCQCVCNWMFIYIQNLILNRW